MPSLKEYKAEKFVIEQALSKLETLTISESKKSKIKNIIQNSRFNGIYSDFFLAEDPQAFRNSLAENIQLEQEAKDLGINLRIIEEGIPDQKIELKIDYKNKESIAPEKITNYIQQLDRFYSQIVENMTLNFQQALPSLLTEHHIPENGIYNPHWTKVDQSEEDNEDDYSQTELEEYSPRENYDPIDEKEIELYHPIDKNYGDPELENFTQGLRHICSKEDGCFSYLTEKIYQMIDSKNSFVLENLLSDSFQQFYSEKLSSIELFSLLKDTSSTTLVEKYFAEKKENQLLELTRKAIGYINKVILDAKFESDQILPAEFEILERHLVGTNDSEDLVIASVSSKLKKATNINYFVKLEPLLPEDVTFGNDGGCCQAITTQSLGIGDNIPFYQLDKGTLVFGVYQQFKNKNPNRVGMILSFVTKDQNNNPVLLCNSHELSSADNPLPEEDMHRLINHTLQYLKNFCTSAGFKRLAIGNHQYNTCKNFIDNDSLEQPEKDTLQKLPTFKKTVDFNLLEEHFISREEYLQKPEHYQKMIQLVARESLILESTNFYSEVLKSGFSIAGNWSYTKNL